MAEKFKKFKRIFSKRGLRKATGQEEPYKRPKGEEEKYHKAMDKEDTAKKLAREYNELMEKKRKK
jgi:hypothetical protein